MSDETVDKVDYYESFEIYKNATNQIIQKAKANRSFSFDDAPVDPRKLIAGHNIKDLGEDGFTPKVRRVDWGVEQRSIEAHKTKAAQRNERYATWCAKWTEEMEYLLKKEVEHTIKDITIWLEKSERLREEVSRDSESAGCYGRPHYLESSLKEREETLNEVHSHLLEKMNEEIMGLALQVPNRYFGSDKEK